MNNNGKILLPIGALISVAALISGMSFSVPIKITIVAILIAILIVMFVVIRHIVKDKARNGRVGAIAVPIVFGISALLRANKSDNNIIMGFIIFGIVLQVIGLIFVLKNRNDA